MSGGGRRDGGGNCGRGTRGMDSVVIFLPDMVEDLADGVAHSVFCKIRSEVADPKR